MRLLALGHKARLYGYELRFARKAVPDPRQRWALLRHTVAFHWQNARRSSRRTGQPFDLALTLAGPQNSTYAANVQLRPGTGDLAIFYEILAREAYAVQEGVVDADAPLTIVDAGANIGMTALYFASRYPQARIFAIEPNPDNFALLKRNTASEPRITALQACVTPLPRQTVFIETSGPAWGFRTNSAQRGVPVRGVSLAELMDDYGLARIDSLKIAIEGAERDVFAEGEFLTRVSAIVAELHGGYTLAHLNRDLAAAGLKAHVSPFANDPQVVIASRA